MTCLPLAQAKFVVITTWVKLAVGPRLWLDVAGAQCLRTLGPCAPHLRELALLLVGDVSCAATRGFAWARVVPVLVAHRTLVTQRIELDLRMYSFPPEAAWADGGGYALLALLLSRMFGGLAALPLPRLRSLTVNMGAAVLVRATIADMPLAILQEYEQLASDFLGKVVWGVKDSVPVTARISDMREVELGGLLFRGEVTNGVVQLTVCCTTASCALNA
jgi:hypothetical protein